MKSIAQLQKQYPDTIKCDLKTSKAMSLTDVRKMANSIYGQESTILQGSITNKRTIIYVSKMAFAQGVKDESPIFNITIK